MENTETHWQMSKNTDKRGRRSYTATIFFISAGFPTKVTHLVSDKWHSLCFTDGASAEIHTGLYIYLSHRCFVLCFLASKATAQLCWGITSRCSTKERPCYPTESTQTAPPCTWGHSATVQIRKGLAHSIFVMVIFVVQKHRTQHHPNTDLLKKLIYK